MNLNAVFFVRMWDVLTTLGIDTDYLDAADVFKDCSYGDNDITLISTERFLGMVMRAADHDNWTKLSEAHFDDVRRRLTLANVPYVDLEH